MLSSVTYLIVGLIAGTLVAGSVWLFVRRYRRSAATALSMAVLTAASILISTGSAPLHSFFAVHFNICASMAGITFFWFAVGNRNWIQRFFALSYIAASCAYGVELQARWYIEPEYSQIMTTAFVLWLTVLVLFLAAIAAFLKKKFSKKPRSNGTVVKLRKHA